MTPLIAAFGSEFAVLHRTRPADLAAVAGNRIAETIATARASGLLVRAGGGGNYGRVLR